MVGLPVPVGPSLGPSLGVRLGPPLGTRLGAAVVAASDGRGLLVGLSVSPGILSRLMQYRSSKPDMPSPSPSILR